MESDSQQYHTALSHVFCKYLRENEFISETILDCLSGTQMGCINETKCQKSRDTVKHTYSPTNQTYTVAPAPAGDRLEFSAEIQFSFRTV